MKILALVAASLVAMSAVASASDKSLEGPTKPIFVKFDDFLKAVGAAKYADYQNQPGVKVADEKEFEAMKAHILNHYKGVTTTHSFMLENGNYIDCVPILQQPALQNLPPAQRKLAAAPPPVPVPADQTAPAPPPGNILPATRPTPVGLNGGKDQFGNERSCPDGSIPLPRLSLDTMVKFSTLSDFAGGGKKGPR